MRFYQINAIISLETMQCALLSCSRSIIMMQINAIISLKLYEVYKFIVRLGNNS